MLTALANASNVNTLAVRATVDGMLAAGVTLDADSASVVGNAYHSARYVLAPPLFCFVKHNVSHPA